MSDPTLWTAVEQAAAIRERRLGSEELLDLFVARIDEVDPAVNAVCTLAVEPARLRCREADAASARGESWGQLHGLPITVKDAIETAGMRSTGGSVELAEHVPTTDAPAVASLKDAGAVVFGKTNLPEWSGDWQSYNELFGTTNNPWDLTRTPGGSSGGAAAAVACGMTSFELGTDIGGSVRVPSAFCGVFGHKPSFGIIPTYGYLDEPTGGRTQSDNNTFGPIARGAADLEMLLSVLAAPGPADRLAWRLDLPPAGITSLRGLRVGAWIDEPELVGDQAMTRVLHSAVDAIEAAGAAVDRTARPAIDVAHMWRLGALLIGAAVDVHPTDASSLAISHHDWLRVDRQRAMLRAAWAELFERVDVVLCPVTLVPAFEHLHEGSFDSRVLPIDGVPRRYLEMEGWPALVGAAYLPSTATPVGITPDGLPVGVQVVAPYLRDRLSIKVAGLIADTTGGVGRPPIVRSR